jgi:CcmD family protein
MSLEMAFLAQTSLASPASPATSAAPAVSDAPSAADDRATTFQPTEGGSEQRSGSTLMVEAYAVIWTLLMVWLVMLWRKQAALNARLDGLEGAIVKASAKPAPAAPSP